MPGTAPAVAEARLRPVINSTTELAEWDSFVATKGWRGGAALHVDTGMHRLGISPEEAIAIAPRLQSENHGLTLLMSHLACADMPDHPLNDKQIRLFRDIRINFRGLAVLARQFVRDLHRQHGPLRPGAPGHRALRLEPDTRTPQSHAAGRRTQGPHHPGARARPRRHGRLWRELQRRPAEPHRDRRRGLCATATCARRAPPRPKPPRTWSSAASSARSSAASPWT